MDTATPGARVTLPSPTNRSGNSSGRPSRSLNAQHSAISVGSVGLTRPASRSAMRPVPQLSPASRAARATSSTLRPSRNSRAVRPSTSETVGGARARHSCAVTLLVASRVDNRPVHAHTRITPVVFTRAEEHDGRRH